MIYLKAMSNKEEAFRLFNLCEDLQFSCKTSSFQWKISEFEHLDLKCYLLADASAKRKHPFASLLASFA